MEMLAEFQCDSLVVFNLFQILPHAQRETRTHENICSEFVRLRFKHVDFFLAVLNTHRL